MIFCPNCQHHEISGALFCSECGVQLVQVADAISQDVAHSPHASSIEAQKAPSSPPHLKSNALISLHLTNTGQVLPLAGRNEYTLGRASEDQQILPDVDLVPYGAYDSGLSRLHATISLAQEVTIMDLGSINGTQVNGMQIPPNTPQSLTHGDILTLGRMEIQILFRE